MYLVDVTWYQLLTLGVGQLVTEDVLSGARETTLIQVKYTLLDILPFKSKKHSVYQQEKHCMW